MPSVQEGLTTPGEAGFDAGVDSEEGFNAALAAKVGQSRETPAAPAERRHTPVTPDTDTAAQIKRQLLEDEGSTKVADGLEVPNAERAKIHEDYLAAERELAADPAHQEWLANEARRSALEQSEKLELQDLREDAAIDRFDTTAITGDDAEITFAFARLKSEVSPDRFEEALQDYFGVDEDTDPDDPVWDVMGEIDTQADEILATADYETKLAFQQAVEAQVTELTMRDTKAMLNEWVRSEGISAAEGRARITQVEQFTEHSLLDIAQTAGVAKAENVLRAGDATMREAAYAERVQKFKEDFVNEPSTSVQDGLTINAGMGHIPVAPRPVIGQQMREERVVARAVKGGRQTPEQIKAELMSTSDLESEYARVQRIAGREFEARQPKPRNDLL